MPRVLSLDPLLRDSVSGDDLFVIYDVSVPQEEPLHKITVQELASAVFTIHGESDNLNTVTNRGNTTSNSITVGGATINGDLTVTGTTTTVSSETVTIDDNILLLNSNATGSATENSGFEVERGDDPNVQFIWDEANDRWSLGSQDLFTTGDLIGNVNVSLTTDSVGEGTTNLYYTKSRVDSDIDENLNNAFSVQLIIYDSANSALKTLWGSSTSTY